MKEKKKPLLKLVKTSSKNLLRPLYLIHLFCIFFLLFVSIKPVCSQQSEDNSPWRLYPLIKMVKSTHHARLAREDTLELPFWDDFSYADSGTPANNSFSPSLALWAAGSETVRVNTGLDIDPPTVGIATFDGVDADGKPYSNIDTDSGLADSLVSKPINLSTIPVTERESVWLSFFWQQFGRGEFPDPEDSLRLQFKNNQGSWQTVWSRAGGDTLATNEFKQEMIQLLNPGFFHAAFRFRFQSFNRLSGAFDTWNVDYIYLNSGRSASNTAYPDRALTSLPSSPLGQYTAVPMEQYKVAPERYTGASEVNFYNLNVQLQPVRFTAQIRDGRNGNLIQLLDNDLALSPIPTGFARRTIVASELDPTQVDTNLDSLSLKTEFFLTSGDNFLIENISSGDTLFSRSVDYRVNDTVSATFVLNDYFAYDDGEAEFGVELNLNGGKVAYQYAAPRQDLLTHLDVYFPPLRRNQQSIPIRLFVWESLTDSAGNEVVLRTEQAQASSSGFLGSFTRFELASPVTVRDTFYIGYEQQGESFLAVGFDKNKDTADKIFFNVTGAWEQNLELDGSLMMRPVFDRERQSVVLSAEDNIDKPTSVTIYPNPSAGGFRVNQPFDKLLLTDISGKLLRTFSTQLTPDTLLYTELPPGIYLAHIFIGGNKISRKLIIR